MLIYGWENPYSQIGEEIKQIQFEGKIIPEEIMNAYNKLHPKTDRHNDEALEPIFKKLQGACNFKVRSNWNYIQPNNLTDIKKERPVASGNPIKKIDKTKLLKQLHGACTKQDVYVANSCKAAERSPRRPRLSPLRALGCDRSKNPRPPRARASARRRTRAGHRGGGSTRRAPSG